VPTTRATATAPTGPPALDVVEDSFIAALYFVSFIPNRPHRSLATTATSCSNAASEWPSTNSSTYGNARPSLRQRRSGDA